jgi:hypothetical protein
MSALDPPRSLSIVVTLVSGRTEDLASCLLSLRNQEDSPDQEILVPYDDPCCEVTRLANLFPDVKFIRAGGLDFAAARAAFSHEPYDALRTIGLLAARSSYVALTEDQATLAPRWCRTLVDLLDTHPELGAIGCAIECGSNRRLNRAVCYCDFGRYQNPLPEGPSAFVSDSNVVYRRSALDEIRGVWESGFHEILVHQELVKRGRAIWLTPRVTAWQNRPEMTMSEALRERYVWGRAFAGIRFPRNFVGLRFFYACLSPALPALLTLRAIRRVCFQPARLLELLPALPYVAALNSAWAWGEFIGYATGSSASNSSLRLRCRETVAAPIP